jgi:hypothetical protein
MHRQATYQGVTRSTAAPVTPSLPPTGEETSPPRRKTRTAPTPSCDPPASAPTPSSRPGTSCANYAAAPGVPGSWPKPSTSFKPARSEDEKGSLGGRRQDCLDTEICLSFWPREDPSYPASRRTPDKRAPLRLLKYAVVRDCPRQQASARSQGRQPCRALALGCPDADMRSCPETVTAITQCD